MTGFFPIMMIGLPMACYAMYLLSKKENKKAMAGIFFSVAFTSFLTGITEPVEFMFLFLAPMLYIMHALLTGAALAVTHLLGIKHGFGFSAGLIDYIVNFNLATKPWLLLIVGAIFGAIYFLLFYTYIKTLNVKTPGREDAEMSAVSIDLNPETINNFAQALGGIKNLVSIDSCITRLRLEVKDTHVINEQQLKSLGAQGIVKPSPTTAQIVLGQISQQIADELNKIKG